MATTTIRQDMPPPGGYNKIQYERIPAKTYFKGRTLMLGYIAMTAGATYIFSFTLKRIYKEKIEARSAMFALTPLLQAENDREKLRQIRKNREYEKELMKNVEGWEVGTLYGEPIYKTVPKDHLRDIYPLELFAHSSYREYTKKFKAFLRV